MPDPVSKAEIEDVLTSIRRLVSENRPVGVAAESAETDAEDPREPETDAVEAPVENAPMALVLTPALRVEDDAEDADGDLDLAGFEAEDEADFEVAEIEDDPEESFLDEEVQVPEAVFDDRSIDADQWHEDALEAEFSDDVEDAEDIAFVHAEHDIDEDVEGEEGWAAPDVSEEVEDNPETQSVVEELRDDGWEDTEPEAEAGFIAVEEPQDEEASEEPFDFKKVLEARLVNFQDGAAPDAPEDEPVDSDYAEPEVVADVVEDELPVEPALEATQFVHSPVDSISHYAEAHVAAEVFDGTSEAIEAGLSDALDEPAVIDEEALREMVADIVRQELQGALGERITRNVRKLVRREIHRALAAHDLD